jgi:hypothetical protein
MMLVFPDEFVPKKPVIGAHSTEALFQDLKFWKLSDLSMDFPVGIGPIGALYSYVSQMIL